MAPWPLGTWELEWQLLGEEISFDGSAWRTFDSRGFFD
jgi:hypothetical protein